MIDQCMVFFKGFFSPFLHFCGLLLGLLFFFVIARLVVYFIREIGH